MWHAWERREKCTSFFNKKPKERDHSEDRGVDGRMGTRMNLGEIGWGVWDGFIWLGIGAGGGLF
jgi:hypothetical protein